MSWFRTFCCVVALSAMPAAAEPTPSKDAPGVIDQLVLTGFVPTKSFILETPARGSVVEMKATSAVLPPELAREVGSGRVLVGAFVPREPNDNEIRFTFFLKGEAGQFSATPVRVWSRDVLDRNTIPFDQLATQSTLLKDDLATKSAELQTLETEVVSLRRRASEVAGVDEIVDLKMELARFKGVGETKTEEEERLRTLVNRARKIQPSSDANERRRELSDHLREAARVSASAARLSRRRKEAARTSLKRKIALIKEMGAYDAESLAKELLQLRARRKELEAKLGGGSKSSAETGNDF